MMAGNDGMSDTAFTIRRLTEVDATLATLRLGLGAIVLLGVGAALALGMLSTLSADRLVRAIRERDLAALQGVPRVGRKKAERLILDLADKLDDVQGDVGGVTRPDGAGADDAIRALVSLGYASVDAEKAVRTALDEGGRGLTAPELIRRALSKVSTR